MREQLKTDRVAQIMLVGMIVTGIFACLMIGFIGYLYSNQNRPPSIAVNPQQSTPTPTSTTQPRPTPTYTRIPELEKKFWDTVDIRALVKNPDRYIGDQLHYQGEVFTIEEERRGAVMQVWVDVPGSDYDQEAVVVIFQGTTDNVYIGTEIEFWGYGAGTFEGENAFGGIIRQPIVEAEHLTYFR